MKKTLLASTLFILLSVTTSTSAENRTILIEKKKSEEITIQNQSKNSFSTKNFTIDELKIDRLGNGKIHITANNLKNRNSGEQLSYNITSNIHEIEDEVIIENLVLNSNNSNGELKLTGSLKKDDLNSNSDIFSLLSTSNYFDMEIVSSSSLAKMIYLLDIKDNEFLNKLNNLKSFTIDERLKVKKNGKDLIVEDLTLKLKDVFYIKFNGTFNQKDFKIVKNGTLEFNFNTDSELANKILQILNIKYENQKIQINNENIENIFKTIR